MDVIKKKLHFLPVLAIAIVILITYSGSGYDKTKTSGDDSSNVKLNWVRHYSGADSAYNYPRSFTVDHKGNVYVTGTATDNWPYVTFVLLKYNLYGEELWAIQYDGPEILVPAMIDIEVDTAGDVYVGGTSHGDETDADLLVVKYGSSGTKLWNSFYSEEGKTDERLRAIAIDDSGNVYAAGVTNATEYETNDYIILKYNQDGELKWKNRKEVSISGNSTKDIAVDNFGNVYFLGNSSFYETGRDFILIKYDTRGNEEWIIQENESAEAARIGIDENKNIYATGTGNIGSFIVKYDSKGKKQWQAESEVCSGVIDFVYDDDGNVYITGSTQEALGATDYVTIKYNAEGKQEWLRLYDGIYNDYDQPRGIAIDDYDNIYVTGSSTAEENNSGPASGVDIVTVKYNSEGEEEWELRFDGGYNDYDNADGIEIYDDKYIYIFGFTYVDFYDLVYTTLQYEQEITVGIHEESNQPAEYKLYQNYPNPFNPSTTISYQLPVSSHVQLIIYDILGKKVATIINQEQKEGEYEIRWDGRTGNGEQVSTGVYLYELKAGKYRDARKMILIH